MYKDFVFVNRETTDAKAINNSIRNILLTRKGSVPGRPRFGSDLYKLIFSHIDSTIKNIAKNMIFEALNEFENRIILDSIDIQTVEEYNKVVCNIVYRYKDDFNAGTESLNVSLI